MLTWLRRFFRRPRLAESTEQADAIIDTAREMRLTMLQETKASRSAQRELRRNPLLDAYMKGSRHAE